jgi:hypothetical protein
MARKVVTKSPSDAEGGESFAVTGWAVGAVACADGLGPKGFAGAVAGKLSAASAGPMEQITAAASRYIRVVRLRKILIDIEIEIVPRH